MPLIAIASSDGTMIDGRIDYPGIFRIYRFDAHGEWSLLELRSPPRRPGARPFPLCPQTVALLLADVRLILAASVPKPAALFLRSRGIMAFPVQGEVCRALEAYGKRGRLFENLFINVRTRYSDSLYPTTPEER